MSVPFFCRGWKLQMNDMHSSINAYLSANNNT